MLESEDYTTEQSSPFSLTIREIMAYFVLGLGLLTTFGLMFSIYTLFTDPSVLANFRPLFPDGLVVSLNDDQVVIFPELLIYAMPIALFTILMRLAIALLNTGTNMVNNEKEVGRGRPNR